MLRNLTELKQKKLSSMKECTVSIFFMSFLIISCSNEVSHKNEKRGKIAIDESINLKELKKEGVLVINIRKLKEKKDILNFYSASNHKEKMITFNNKFIATKQDTCFYNESSCEEEIIKGCLAINLEFDVFIVPNVTLTEDGYYFILNGIPLFSPKSKYLRIETYQEHLSKHVLALKKISPLRENPSDSSKIISNFTNYEYNVISFEGNWVNLTTTSEYDTTIIGWAKWIKGDSLLVYPVYWD